MTRINVYHGDTTSPLALVASCTLEEHLEANADMELEDRQEMRRGIEHLKLVEPEGRYTWDGGAGGVFTFTLAEPV